jgi:hypothetical protein
MIRSTIMLFVAPLVIASMSLADARFDLARLTDVQGPTGKPVGERIALGVDFLRDEIANPSPDSWGLAGGPIDTGYILQQITRALSFPSARSPATLREYRDREPKGLLRDCLTIALGATGAQDGIPDLLRIASKEPLGGVRCEAIIVIGRIGRAPSRSDSPQRIRPGEVWKPLDPKTDAAIESALLAGLADTRMCYGGVRKVEANAWYANQYEAALGLRLRGRVVKHTRDGEMVTGWRVLSKEGKLLHSVTLASPLRRQREDADWD